MLGGALLVPRAYLVGWRGLGPWRDVQAKELARLLLSGTYDVAYAAVLAGLFLILVAPFRRRRRAGIIIYCAFLATAVLSLIVGVVNIEIVHMLGRPLNYRWLYYADFLNGAEARAGLRASVSATRVIVVLSACLVYVLGSIVLGNSIERRTSAFARRTRTILAIGGLAVLGVYLAGGHYYLTSRSWPYEKLANPVYAYLSSWILTARAPPLFTMHTGVDAEDFAPARTVALPAQPPDGPGIRHVIVFVLESTPAEYLGAYGSKLRRHTEPRPLGT